MSVYKEGFMIVEDLKSRSQYIFNDAADFGVPTKKDDATWNMVKQLTDWYGVKNTRKEHRYDTGRSVQMNVELMNEWTDGSIVTYIIEFVSCETGKCKGFDGYVYCYKA